MSVLNTIPRMISRRWILTTTLVIVAVAVCARLGIWQLDRLAGRREFNSHILAMRALPELDLNFSTDVDVAAQEYRRASAEGTYDFANQFAIRNQYHHNEFGYHLITPLRLPDGRAVLVDRGWVPAEGNDSPSGWSRYDVAGPLRVRGLIRLGTSESTFGGLADPTLSPNQSRLDFWNFINFERLPAQIPYPILDVYLQLDPTPADDEPPIPFQPEIELSEGPHMGYAIQWFSFAAMMLFGYPFYLRKQFA